MTTQTTTNRQTRAAESFRGALELWRLGVLTARLEKTLRNLTPDERAAWGRALGNPRRIDRRRGR